MPTINPYEWNWDNAIFVNDEITDTMVSSLAPEILKLKQRNPTVITVGIDSVGGSVTAATQLLALLKAPGTTHEVATVVTVALNKAYSAAATLLALGDYAVALPSARIHYHDVRFDTYHDLTPSKATEAARILQRENDRVALRLAHSVVERLTWMFIDLNRTFDDVKKELPKLASRIDELGLAGLLAEGGPMLDFTGFVCAQFKETSPMGDQVIDTALDKLHSWRALEVAHSEFSKANKPDADTAALFRDDNPLLAVINNSLPADKKFSWSVRKGLQNDLVLLFLLLFRRAAADSALRMNEETISDLMVEYAFFNEIRQKQHVDKALNLVLEDDYVLFGDFVGTKLKDASKEERVKIWRVVYPQVQTYWAYVVLLCRTLFDGEHPITLEDALYLGLIDEVSGRDFPEPRRHIRARNIARQLEESQKQAKGQRKWLRSRGVRR